MRFATRERRALPALLLLATVLMACGGDGATGNDFSIDVSVSPSTLTLEQGTSGSVTLTLVRGGGFSEAVSASVSGLPSGVTATVTPGQLTGNTTSATVNVSVGSSVTPGTYTATVTASAAGVGSATATYQLTVTATPDYSLTTTPTSLNVQAGGSGTATVNIARTNFTGVVALTLGNAPQGVTGSFNPSNATGTTSDLTVNVAASVAAGTYQVSVNGAATGPGNRSATISLTVTAAPDYTLSVQPGAISVQAGTSQDVAVNIARTNFTGAVTLSLVNPPAGVSGAFNPPAPTANSSTLTVTVDNTVAPGVHTLTIMGAASGVPTRLVARQPDGDRLTSTASAAGDRTTTLQLTVTAGAGISLSAGPSSVPALQGGIASSTITITRAGFPDAVDLSASGAPAGMTVSFNPDNTLANAATATVVVGAAVPVGNHVVTITGSGTGISNASTQVTVQVSAPPSVFNTEQKFDGPVAPEFYATQNGNGGWQQVLPLFDAGTGVYSFRTNMTAGFGGVYYVFDNGGFAGTVNALYQAGLLGPEDLMGAFAGRRTGFMASRLRTAASMAPTLGGEGKLTVQSFGTPGELNALGAYFAPQNRVNVFAGVLNGTPRTNVWVGGRHAMYDGSQSTVAIEGILPARLSYGLVASRFNASNLLDAVHVKTTVGTGTTLDMQGTGSAAPLFTPVTVGGASAMTGAFSHLWRSGNFVGVVDIVDVGASPSKSVGAPQLAQWGSGGFMGISTYDTDELSFKRKFTGFENNWNAKSTSMPALLSATTNNTNGYEVNFGAPTEFGLPFRGAVGAIFPSSFMGNAIVGTATAAWFQMSGQAGPNYTLRYFEPDDVGAPPESALGNDNYLLFGVTRSVSCLADGLTPLPVINSIHTQTLRLMNIGYPYGGRR